MVGGWIAFISHTARWIWALDTRFAELVLGAFLLARGTIWAVPGNDMSERVYAPLVALMPGEHWGGLLVACGIAQIGGVIINGRWRKSPMLRCIVLLISLIVYTVIAMSFAEAADSTGGLQATIQQSLFALFSFWAIVNIADKNWHRNGR